MKNLLFFIAMLTTTVLCSGMVVVPLFEAVTILALMHHLIDRKLRKAQERRDLQVIKKIVNGEALV